MNRLIWLFLAFVGRFMVLTVLVFEIVDILSGRICYDSPQGRRRGALCDAWMVFSRYSYSGCYA